MLERIQCRICPKDFIIRSGESHEGLCRVCRKLEPDVLEETANFYQSVRSGEIFTPSALEIASQREPAEWNSQHQWSMERNWYLDSIESIDSIDSVLDHAESDSDAYLSFVSDRKATFWLVANEKYSVCRYQNSADDPKYFSYSDCNSTTQIVEHHQLCGTCSCCGII